MNEDANEIVRYTKPYFFLIVGWLLVDLSGVCFAHPAINLTVNFLFFIVILPFVLHFTSVLTMSAHPKFALFILAPGVLLSEIFNLIPLKIFQRTLTQCLSMQMVTLTSVEEFDDAEKIAARLTQMHGPVLTGLLKSFVSVVTIAAARARGDFSLSEAKAREAVAFNKAAGHANTQQLSAAYSDLGVALANQGKSTEAIAACLRGVALLEDGKSKAERTIFAMGQNNLGLVYNMCGNHVEAQERYKISRDIKIELLGPTAWQVALAEVNLACVTIDSGDYAAAAVHVATAAEILKNKPGVRKVLLAGLASVQGEVERDAGRLDSAEKYLQKALKIYARASEKGDIDQLYHFLGKLYVSKGDKVQAAKYFKLALDFRLKHFGPDHFKTQQTRTEAGEYLT